MSALIVRPLPFTEVIGGNANPLTPVSYMLTDHPAIVWRSANLTSVFFIVDMGSAPVAYDTVALIGSNLRATDTVRVQTGTTATGIGGASALVSAYS